MNRSLRNKYLILTLTFVLAFAMTTPAAAQGLITGDTIPAGTVYDHDAILIGQNVVIDGTVNGNVFVLGNQVTVNGKVDGSIILIGQNAGIGGTINGDVYAAALTLDLAPHAALGRDLYVATVSLTSGNASVIGRDLYALGLDSGLNGQVGRDLHTVIGPIQIYNGLMTLLGYDNLTIKLHFETPNPASSPSGSLISPGQHTHFRVATAPQAKAFDWGKWGLNLLRNWAVLFLFSLLALWRARKSLDRSGEPLHAHPWQSLGTGLVVLVIAFALVGVGLLLAVIIFAIGLGLNFLGLWQLSLALWASAFACLGLAMVALWFFIVYGTKIIVLYLLATWIFGKLFHRKAVWLDILALLAGTVVYTLLRSAPYVGWIFDILVTAVGAGAGWLAFQAARKNREPVIQPVEAKPVIIPVESKPVPFEEQPTIKMSRKKK
jgi:hypothetical protein